MTHAALRIIEDEHRSIAAVLHGLLYLVRETEERGATPDFTLLHAILDYIVAFPQRLHHPKEDEYLFKLLLERDPQAADLIDQLEQEHARGDQLIHELQQALLRYERSGAAEAASFATVVRSYAEFHWAHMRKEEQLALPRAEKALTEADWEKMAAAFKENDDPLFGIKPKEELHQLFQRILNLAPPPIGIGPEKH